MNSVLRRIICLIKGHKFVRYRIYQESKNKIEGSIHYCYYCERCKQVNNF